MVGYFVDAIVRYIRYHDAPRRRGTNVDGIDSDTVAHDDAAALHCCNYWGSNFAAAVQHAIRVPAQADKLLLFGSLTHNELATSRLNSAPLLFDVREPMVRDYNLQISLLDL